MTEINLVSQSVSQTVNTLTTTLTLKYCPSWGIWEAIREIESNALDVIGTLADLNFINGNLEISDKGRGIELKELMLLGISQKEISNSIGKFGEGLKVAMIIFSRFGYLMEVKAHNFIVKVSTIEVFGEQVLKYDWNFFNENFTGTKLTIFGISQEHVNEILDFVNEKFVSKNTTKLFETFNNGVSESIMEGNSLFNKTVFVQKLETSKFSYNLSNLRLERDRNTANEYELKYHLGCLIGKIEDKELIKQFLGYFRKECLESQINSFDPKHSWKEAFIELYGELATVTNNEDILSKARYLGIKAIYFVSSEVVNGLNDLGILTTEQAIKEKLQGKKEELTTLTNKQKSILETSINVIKACTNLRFPQIKIYKASDSILGYSDQHSIGLSDLMLETYGDCLTTLLEELVHNNFGYSDGTPEFQIQFIKEVTNTINAKGKSVFQAKLLKSKNKVNGKDYFQYSIKLPSKLELGNSDVITVSII
jgi:hypothetical protein